MKLSRLEINLTIATSVVIIGIGFVYITKPLPQPNISIELQGYWTESEVFHMTPETNFSGQFCYNSQWLECLPSSTTFPLKETNILCEVYLTNRGPTRVWWTSVECTIEAKTPNGWITNIFKHFTTMPNSVGKSEKDAFHVYVPIDAIEWRVRGDYTYYKRHSPRDELVGWLFDDLHVNPTRLSSYFLIGPLLPIVLVSSCAPEPKEMDGTIFSNYFTNKPPSSVTP